MRSVAAAFVSRHSDKTFRPLLTGRVTATTATRRVASFQRFESVASDYTIVDDDDDDNDETPLGGANLTFFADADDKTSSNEVDESLPIPTKRSMKKKPRKETVSSSWMDKNTKFSFDEPTPKQKPRFDREREPRNNNRRKKNDRNSSFKDDFRGTRVFVQGLNRDTSWQDLKDHFRTAGEVVFASVSVDGETGQSKGCGVVQFETTAEAQNAIKIMRDHPLDGETLYVREDVQEKAPMPRGGGNTTPPSKWKCANEANMESMPKEERDNILSIIKARDQARRRRNYEASDDMREELKQEYGIHLDDRLKLWWSDVNGKPPEMIEDIKGEGRWGKTRSWRQIPTTPENDACVDPNLVEGLLKQRDIARREKDFETADALLEEARTAPDGDLCLRIHDESRTWRVWTEAPPPKPSDQGDRGKERVRQSAAEQCVAIVSEHAPAKVAEVRNMLEKFPGREYSILKKLKQRYVE